MASHDVTIKRKDIAAMVCLKFRFDSGRTWGARLWLAQMLMHLAGFVLGVNVSVEVEATPIDAQHYG